LFDGVESPEGYFFPFSINEYNIQFGSSFQQLFTQRIGFEFYNHGDFETVERKCKGEVLNRAEMTGYKYSSFLLCYSSIQNMSVLNRQSAAEIFLHFSKISMPHEQFFKIMFKDAAERLYHISTKMRKGRPVS